MKQAQKTPHPYHRCLDDKGSLSVELAFILPIFLAILLGLIEVSHVYFLNATLENAVLRASRFGITGSTKNGLNREEQIRAIISKETFGQINGDELTIETLIYPSFGEIGASEPFTDLNGNSSYDPDEPFSDINGNSLWDADIAQAGLGGSGDVILYRIQYPAKSLTGFGQWALRDIQLTASVAVRNEPF